MWFFDSKKFDLAKKRRNVRVHDNLSANFTLFCDWVLPITTYNVKGTVWSLCVNGAGLILENLEDDLFDDIDETLETRDERVLERSSASPWFR